MKGLGTRTISGALGLLVLLFIVYKGGLYLSLSVLLLSIIGILEFNSAMRNINLKPNNYVGVLSSVMFFLLGIIPSLTIDFVITAITLMLLIYFLFSKSSSIANIGVSLFGILYIPFLLFHIIYLDGTKYIWLVFIIAFGTDTFAYFAGNLFGKNKLCPKISPNKTIEGSIGGIVGSLLLSILFSIYTDINPLWKVAILSIITSIVSQIGDLVASKIKRETRIKDFGDIIPGHGGIIDRFDSIILTAPVIYYLVRYFI